MKIGIVARGLTKGGVARYIKNILAIFDEQYTDHFSFTVFTDNTDFSGIYKNLEIVYIPSTSKLWWDYFKVIPSFVKHKTDVVLYPKNIIPFTHLLFNFKKINVIHDLAYFDNNLHEYKAWDSIYMKLFMKLSCIIADKIIAVSNSTKESIIKVLKINSDKIRVIYEGVEKKFEKELDSAKIENTLSKYNISTPFIFYCGSLSPRKNILITLKAFYEIKNLISHKIILAGGQSWHDEDVINFIKKNLNDRVSIIGYVNDDDLINLYSSADLYLYPSLYEGFGLPILEAQSCGCPVLISNKTSCPEIAGEGGVIVDPFNVKDISTKITKIITDINFRKEIISKGLENSKKYTWDHTGKKIIELVSVYEK